MHQASIGYVVVTQENCYVHMMRRNFFLETGTLHSGRELVRRALIFPPLQNWKR
jgi:hypothetical protein